LHTFNPIQQGEPLEQSQTIKWNYHIARSKLHPANWTHLDIL